jgi:hypothetical protein
MKTHRSILVTLLTLGGAGTLGVRVPAVAQEVLCYRKKCVEYPDGSKICQLTPVDCTQVQ